MINDIKDMKISLKMKKLVHYRKIHCTMSKKLHNNFQACITFFVINFEEYYVMFNKSLFFSVVRYKRPVFKMLG